MTNNQIVERLYTKHNDFVKMCTFYGVRKYDAEDLVQDLYIKLLEVPTNIEKFLLDGEVNKSYIFITLRNRTLDFKKFEQRYVDLPLEIKQTEYETSEKYQLAVEIIGGHPQWFDRQLSMIYFNDNHSYQSLSKETGIGISTIYKSVNKIKDRVLDKFKSAQFSF